MWVVRFRELYDRDYITISRKVYEDLELKDKAIKAWLARDSTNAVLVDEIERG